jgi:O-acetyl-ADP-ribose deacetylase (regulator of RNase III)
MRRCFVISPIGQSDSAIRNHADDVFRFIVEPAMKAFDIEAVRSDHMPESGRITRQMFREIFQADICVVVLTGFSPNVFYELAVAQCAARPTILLIEEGNVLPFDVKDLRCIQYRLQPIGPLVDGHYARAVEEQIASIDQRGWIVPNLFEQFGEGPQLKTEQQVRQLIEFSRPDPLPPGEDKTYKHPADPDRRIAIVTGDLVAIENLNADVVVSLETTDLQLGRFYDTSISGKLRYLDAERSSGGRIISDFLADGLRHQIAEQDIVLPMMPGSVIANPTHNLSNRGVKMVFHVVALVGSLGSGYRMQDDLVDDSVRNVFDKFAELAPKAGLESILLPMLGAYATRLDLLVVAERILRAVTSRMARTPACRVACVLAWHESQRYAFRHVASEMGLEEVECR